jgi:hypothetical protein
MMRGRRGGAGLECHTFSSSAPAPAQPRCSRSIGVSTKPGHTAAVCTASHAPGVTARS